MTTAQQIEHGLVEGDRVKLVEDVDRFPFFRVGVGALGTVESVSHQGQGHLSIKMDDHIDGAEDWDNCICWDGPYDLAKVRGQVERA